MLFNRLIIPVLLLLSSPGFASATLHDALDSLTKNTRSRLVWLEGGHAEFGSPVMRGYDSELDSAVTIVDSSEGHHVNRPLLCTRGNRVVFTDTKDQLLYSVYIVNWDGSGKRLLTYGDCADVWEDPTTGREWVIVRCGGADTRAPVRKYLVEDPGCNELLWDRSDVGSRFSRSWYQVSADGRRAVSCFPHGVRTLVVRGGGLEANGAYWQAPTDGCWYAMAPDNSYYWFHLYWKNGHTGLFMYRDTVSVGDVPLNSRGSVEEHFHAKFSSNSPGFVVATAGYPDNGSNGSDSAEVYLGRFRADMLGFDGWVRVTENDVGDYCPDAWIGAEPSLGMRIAPESLSVDDRDLSTKAVVLRGVGGRLGEVSVSSDRTWLTVSYRRDGDSVVIANSFLSGLMSDGIDSARVSVMCAEARPSLLTYRVIVRHGKPVVSALRIAPSVARTSIGQAVRYRAEAFDQFGNAMAPATITWSGVGGLRIDSPDGVLVSEATEGSRLLTVRAGAVSASARLQVYDVSRRVKFGAATLSGWSSAATHVVTGDPVAMDSGWAQRAARACGSETGVLLDGRRGKVDLLLSSMPRGTYELALVVSDTLSAPDPQLGVNGVVTPMLSDAFPLAGRAVKVCSGRAEVQGDSLLRIVLEGGPATCVHAAEIYRVEHQALSILSPRISQTYRVGDTIEVTWSVDSSRESSGWLVGMSRDGGRSWINLNSDGAIEQSERSFRFVASSTVGGEPIDGATFVIRVADYFMGEGLIAVSPQFQIAPAVSGSAGQGSVSSHVVMTRDRLSLTRGAAGPYVVRIIDMRGVVRSSAVIDRRGTLPLNLPSGCYVVMTRGAHQRTSVHGRVLLTR